MSSTCPDKGKRKTGCGQSGVGSQVRSKNQAIPHKNITGKKECLNESVCEAEECTSEVFLKSKNLNQVDEEAYEIRLLKTNPANSGSTGVSSYEDKPMPEVNVPLNTVDDASKPVKEELIPDDFTKLVERVRNDNTYTQEKCQKFLCDLRAILDKNTQVNPEELLDIEISNFKSISMKLADVAVELRKFLKCVGDLRSLDLAMKLFINDELRENTDRVYTINSTLFGYFETITEKLRIIASGTVMKGSKQNRLRKGIAEFVEVVEKMNKATTTIQKAIKYLDETYY